MTAKPLAQRQKEWRDRQRDERLAMQAAGLKRLWLWAYPSEEAAVREFLAKLRRRTERAMRKESER